MRLVKWSSRLFLLLILAGGAWFTSYILSTSPTTTDTVVLIPKGASVRNIQTLLAEKNLIKEDIRFLALARISGTAGRLKAGEYRIPPQLKPLQILRILEEGDVILHKVTIPEGMTVRQIATIFEKEKWVDPQRFLELTTDRDFIRKLGLDLASLEGYLFPDTYSLTRGEITEESLIVMMVGRFLEVWNEVTENLAPDLVRQRIVILASIVEKETADPAERPLIARVFHNRLDKKMRLQSDPTVIYGISDFSGNLTRRDLEQESPYNTYTIPGLPAGPICNPGKASIDAVLHPADAPFIYFVSKNDGTHHFSTTLKEHNRAVRQYQKNRSRKKGP